MNDMVTARKTPPETTPETAPHPLRERLLARYNTDSLEAMTPAQLRDAVDYLLAGLDAERAAAPTSMPDQATMPGQASGDTIDAALPLAMQPVRFEMETNLIDLGAALSEASDTFKQLERRFYLAAFGRYDD